MKGDSVEKNLQSRREFLKAAAISLAVTSLPASSYAKKVRGRKGGKPNLLFIMTDQQRFDALSYAGNKVLKTPNMDRIALEGVWFKNAHTQCAVCGPARAAMFTGMCVANNGVITNRKAYLPEEDGIMPMKTYDEILKDNGYECEYYGKWHSPIFRAKCYNNPVTMAGIHKTELGPGHKAVYIEYLKTRYPSRELKEGELMDTLTNRPYRPFPIDTRFDLKKRGKGPKPKFNQSDIHGVSQVPAKYHIPAFQAGEAINAIERLKEKPFSITCSFHHPHPPYLATEEYIKMYPPKKMVPPKNINDGMADSPYLGMKKRTDKKYSDPKMVQYFMSEYYALCKEVDDRVGELLDKLDELGLTDNTMVIFVSDHGEMLGDHGMKGKFCFYEASSHVPMMIKFPGKIKPQTKVKAAVSNMDLFATVLDYFGMPDHPCDGPSLRGLIEGSANEDEAYVVTEWLSDPGGKPTHMVLKGGWKLMRPADSAKRVKKALYNLNDDPDELKNLIANKAGLKKYVSKVAELEGCFKDWIKRTSKKN